VTDNLERRGAAAAIVTSFIGLTTSISPIALSSFGFFIVPLSREFGWSRGQVSGALAVMSFGLAFAGPLHGLWIDRFGLRMPILFSIVAFSAALGSLYWLSAPLWHLYAAFAAIALFAASASPIGYARMLIGRFDRHRGLALGIALAGVGAGSMLVPVVTQTVLGALGWRTAYLILAAVALIPLPLCALIFRRQVHNGATRQSDPEFIASESAASPGRRTFPLLVVIFVSLGAVSVGISAHLVPLLVDYGFPASFAASAATVVGLTIVVSRTGIGWLLDHVHAPLVLAFMTAALAGACFALALPATALVFAGAFMLGLGLGAEVDLMSFMVSRYWPTASFGKLYGLLFGVFLLGSGAGPLALATMFDRFGSYRIALHIAGGYTLLVAALCFALPRYRTMEQSSAPITRAHASERARPAT
jgi:MFS family permease